MGQLRALAAHDAADERRQGHVPADAAVAIEMCNSHGVIVVELSLPRPSCRLGPTTPRSDLSVIAKPGIGETPAGFRSTSPCQGHFPVCPERPKFPSRTNPRYAIGWRTAMKAFVKCFLRKASCAMRCRIVRPHSHSENHLQKPMRTTLGTPDLWPATMSASEMFSKKKARTKVRSPISAEPQLSKTRWFGWILSMLL